ncbi:hypothetical protein [Calothrix sp. NIES-3974]|nr:hypothetical protein [Calothrix sp. NIES-3974]
MRSQTNPDTLDSPMRSPLQYKIKTFIDKGEHLDSVVKPSLQKFFP